mmetsp:Transcript_65535/g.116621  ORF Transcript_65535/g.116621 Transcript_65535/m.116621 type:complete len:651 (-) Transcript_65535:2353-4305(-)
MFNVKFHLPPERAAETPSIKDGVPQEVERNNLCFAIQVMQEASQRMQLESSVFTRASILLHRFFSKKSVRQYDVKEMITPALVLACKLDDAKPEGTGRDLRLLIRMAITVVHHILEQKDGKVDPPVLEYTLGEGDYGKYVDIFNDRERDLLAALGFIFYVEHPQRYLFFFTKITGLDDELVQCAWNYMLDSLRLNIHCYFPGNVVATACIYLAFRKLGRAMPKCEPPWWELFDTSTEDLISVTKHIMCLFDGTTQAKYEYVVPRPKPIPTDDKKKPPVVDKKPQDEKKKERPKEQVSKETTKDRDKEKDSTRDREREKDTTRDRDRDKDGTRDKDKSGDKDRERDRNKEKEKNRDRERDRDKRDKDKDKDRDRPPKEPRDREREREKDREKDRSGKDRYRDQADGPQGGLQGGEKGKTSRSMPSSVTSHFEDPDYFAVRTLDRRKRSPSRSPQGQRDSYHPIDRKRHVSPLPSRSPPRQQPHKSSGTRSHKERVSNQPTIRIARRQSESPSSRSSSSASSPSSPSSALALARKTSNGNQSSTAFQSHSRHHSFPPNYYANERSRNGAFDDLGMSNSRKERVGTKEGDRGDKRKQYLVQHALDNKYRDRVEPTRLDRTGRDRYYDRRTDLESKKRPYPDADILRKRSKGDR